MTQLEYFFERWFNVSEDYTDLDKIINKFKAIERKEAQDIFTRAC